MENAFNQGEIGGKRCVGRWEQKKIPYWTWGCWLFSGLNGKNFPLFDCKQECHFIDQMIFVFAEHGQGENMQKIMAGLLLIGCCGCSGGMYSNLVEVEMRLASPMFGEGQRVPVVYPGRGNASDNAMVQAFGPSWRSMEKDYPAYNFNP